MDRGRGRVIVGKRKADRGRRRVIALGKREVDRGRRRVVVGKREVD